LVAEGLSWREGVTVATEKKGDGGRRRPGLDTLEQRIGKAADLRISPCIERLTVERIAYQHVPNNYAMVYVTPIIIVFS
jgi:hypothetical protein